MPLSFEPALWRPTEGPGPQENTHWLKGNGFFSSPGSISLLWGSLCGMPRCARQASGISVCGGGVGEGAVMKGERGRGWISLRSVLVLAEEKMSQTQCDFSHWGLCSPPQTSATPLDCLLGKLSPWMTLCVCVCVCERERERESVCPQVYTSISVCVCLRVKCVCDSVCALKGCRWRPPRVKWHMLTVGVLVGQPVVLGVLEFKVCVA